MFKKKIVASLCVLCSIVAIWIVLDPASASTIIQPAYNLVQNAGSNLLRRTTINFHGAGVTASDAGGVTDVNIPGGGASGYNLVQNAGTPLTMRTTLNCTGSGVVCSDDPLNMVTIIDVPGGGGGSPGNSVTDVTPVTVMGNTTADQTLMELPLGAGYLNTAGEPFLFNGAGVYTTAALQTPTLTFKVKLCTVSGCGSGTVVTLVSIVSAATLAGNTADPWNFSFLGYTAVTGATGKLEIHGPLAADLGVLPGSAAAVFNDTNTAASSAIDLTAALFVDFTVATSTANAGNSITQRAGAVMPFSATAPVVFPRQITLVVGSSDITSVGLKACSVVENAGTITGLRMIANAVPTGADLELGVFKAPFASYASFVSPMSIMGAGAIPTISQMAMNARYADPTLTGWTLSISAGDVFCVAVLSAPTGGATYASLSMDVQ